MQETRPLQHQGLLVELHQLVIMFLQRVEMAALLIMTIIQMQLAEALAG
jgi:hypothetical protein